MVFHIKNTKQWEGTKHEAHGSIKAQEEVKLVNVIN